jgi:hypothetical protein
LSAASHRSLETPRRVIAANIPHMRCAPDVPPSLTRRLAASARRQLGIHDGATELAARRFGTNAGVRLTISTDCGQGDRRTDRAQHAQVAEDERGQSKLSVRHA